ncbi:DUF4393 domain-containing protein [Nocardioidaceae bacterium SCSIO 66511]|nr:DUF4393 domain-containing protein [Nocardioidaceae bacterium SCSIO 66511]
MPTEDQAMPHRQPGDDPRLPLQPVGSSLAMAKSMMRNVPVFGPGIAAAQDELGRVENLIWREVRNRIEQGEQSADGDRGNAPARLADLLTRAVEQSAAQARQHLIARLLDDIEPDEARILAALSDGSTYPLVHLVTKSAFGTTGARLLENVSTVARSAGIALPDYCPIYLARLRRLGLVTVGPESREHADGYEVLATESIVREARDEHDAPTRVLHRTLSLSALGRDLWDLSAPS